MIYKAAIFDFDGTICDTGIGIKKSAKYALDAYDIPCPNWDELDFFIGPPLLVTFQEKFNQSVTNAELLVQKYRERYSDIGLYESELYDGICDMLDTLRKNNVLIGIASSKPEKYVVDLLKSFKIDDKFDAICGVSFNADCESKQSIIARCMNELGVEPKETVMVGDRSYDINGASENGMDSIGVMWGFGTKFEFIESGAKFIAEKVADIEPIVLGMFETTENVQGIFNGRIITVHEDDVRLCDDTTSKRECVDHPGGVAVIGLTDDDKVLMVRQFRYPYKEAIYEIPAGKLEKGEDPLDAGMREFKEECGATADEYIWLGEVYPTPGYTNEIIRLYYAKGLHFDKQELDEGEFLQVHRIDLNEVIDMIMKGEIKDAKTIIATLKINEMRNRS